MLRLIQLWNGRISFRTCIILTTCLVSRWITHLLGIRTSLITWGCLVSYCVIIIGGVLIICRVSLLCAIVTFRLVLLAGSIINTIWFICIRVRFRCVVYIRRVVFSSWVALLGWVLGGRVCLLRVVWGCDVFYFVNYSLLKLFRFDIRSYQNGKENNHEDCVE